MPTKCPCGLDREYMSCCGRYIEGKQHAPTAEALMRSRYSAYAMKRADYIIKTALESDDRQAIEAWMQRVTFVQLEVLRTERGKALDKKGIVEFKAWFEESGKRQLLHEVSAFVKRKGRWFYDEKSSFTP